MLTLINIKKEKDVIEADYFNENERDQLYHMKVDVASGEVIDLKRPKSSIYGTAKLHAKKALLQIAKAESVPEKHTVLWY